MPMDRLVQLVERGSDQLRRGASDDRRKAMGQYYTPLGIAEFMASLSDLPVTRHVRVLDPGAGAGILGICAARSLLQRGAESVHVIAVERDADSLPALNQSLSEAKRSFGSRFSSEVRSHDFLNSTGLGLGAEPIAPVDIAIANPPYFKVAPSDPRGGGAPNIYAQFMNVASELLAPGGQMCFIVPRSYSSGLYFRDFRRRFHRTMALEAVHLFRSRAEAFKTDGVLQENIIILCRREGSADGHVRITVSNGTDDLPGGGCLLAPRRRIVDPDTRDAWLYLPESRADLRALTTVERQPHLLADLGWAISTGPIVAFRATEHLRTVACDSDRADVPMLWLQHVKPGAVEWPLDGGFRKPQWLSAEAPPKLRVPNTNCVLLRRFSAKGDPRRLIAAPLLAGQLPGDFVGVENHVNVIYGTERDMTPEDATGLATLLNSRLYERFFRTISGNTQVSASEIRGTRFPSRDRIRAAGARRNRVPAGIGSGSAGLRRLALTTRATFSKRSGCRNARGTTTRRTSCSLSHRLVGERRGRGLRTEPGSDRTP